MSYLSHVIIGRESSATDIYSLLLSACGRHEHHRQLFVNACLIS